MWVGEVPRGWELKSVEDTSWLQLFIKHSTVQTRKWTYTV